MLRARAIAALSLICGLAGCGGVAGGVVPSGDRAPQTLRAVPIVSPTPVPKHADTLRAVPIVSPTPTPAPKHADTLRAVPIVSPTPTPKA